MSAPGTNYGWKLFSPRNERQEFPGSCVDPQKSVIFHLSSELCWTSHTHSSSAIFLPAALHIPRHMVIALHS